MKFLDFFAGIGGFRLGMESAGHKCVGYVEKDKFARKSYEAIYNPEGEWTWDDVTTIDYRKLPRADAWCFGFPCQDISVANEDGKGFNGNKSSLYFAITKRLRQTKEWDTERMPSYLLIENVKNFLSINGGWDFLLVQIELDEIGYDCEWQVLNSKDFRVPQNRERIFIVGHLRGRGTRKIFPVIGEMQNHIKCIGRLDIKGDDLIKRVYDPLGIGPTLNTMQGGNRQPKIIQPVLTPDRINKRQNGRRMKNAGEPMFTLTSQNRYRIYDGYRIRKLTPRECWRLQGFPDDAFDKAATVNSNSQLYKQAGNSVTVNVIYEIAKRL